MLEDDTETSYQVGEFYAPETEGGLRYDDPRLGLDVAAAGRRDVRRRTQAWPLLDEVEAELKRADER